jgi:site-specific recombinase XerD
MLKGGNNTRDYVLFTLGINLGLRIGDLLSLEVKDLFDTQDNIKSYIEVLEQKTKKLNIITVNKNTSYTLTYLVRNEPRILKNRSNNLIYNTRKKYIAISRVQAYKLIKKWCNKVGLTEMKIGTHTLRKSWGYHAHKAGISIEVIQKKYKHKSTSTTREYLGISQKDVDDAYNIVNL